MAQKKERCQGFRIVHPDAAAIDIGSEAHWVAVPTTRDRESVRKFGAFTCDLIGMADWLKSCGIDTVVMEATGTYWIHIYQLLESRGFDVNLVNPKLVKHVPGRKTDQLDCQWLQELHTYGLLSGSFRPENDICVLRSYMRHRGNLVSAVSTQIQLMQKSLIQMNLLLHNVISDITGLTGMNILKAILSGERDPLVLARLRNPKIKASSDEIAKSLQGDYREEHLFTLGQALETHDFFQSQIEACDRKILETLQALEPKLPPDAQLPQSTSTRKKPQQNGPKQDFATPLFRLTGIDLTQIPGIQALTATMLISEIGLDISRFPSEKQFCSWLGLCPSPKISGGKKLGEDRRRVANRAAQLLRIAALSLQKSQTALGAYYRRQRSRLGPQKAIKATAHKLARILYRLLRYGTQYVEAGQKAYEERFMNRQIENLKLRATTLGFTLIPTAPAQSVS